MKKSVCVFLSAIVLACAANVASAKNDTDESYSVVILGDTHFEKLPASVYHDGFNKMTESRAENIELYGKMWEDCGRRLVKRAAALEDNTTRMVFHMGDMIQGYTRDAGTHTRYLDDAYTYLKSEMGPLPFITVAGNHDIRGNSGEVAAAAYREYMLDKLSGELGRPVAGTTFSFAIGPDAYIVIDFNNPDAALIDRLLDETEGARYTFILLHGPVLPYDHVKYYNWILFGRGDVRDDAMRRHFRDRFARRNAIVLCGHTHKTEFADWYSEDGGHIVQMTMNSVWSKDKYGRYTTSIDSPENYGSMCAEKLARQGKEMSEEHKALYDEYRPGLKTYINSKAAGSYKMNVSKDSVTVDFYPGDSQDEAVTFKLR